MFFFFIFVRNDLGDLGYITIGAWVENQGITNVFSLSFVKNRTSVQYIRNLEYSLKSNNYNYGILYFGNLKFNLIIIKLIYVFYFYTLINFLFYNFYILLKHIYASIDKMNALVSTNKLIP